MLSDRLGVWVVVAALAASASAEPVLPETQLPLRLIGTVVASEVERSIAVIENGGATAVVRAGDPIGGARVQEIGKNSVVLAQAGRLERLAFASVLAAAPAGSRLTRLSAFARIDDDASGLHAKHRGSQRAQTSRRQHASRVRAPRAPAVAASSAEADASSQGDATQIANAGQLLVTLSSQASYAPLLDESGKLRGVALTEVRPGSALERIGLRSGDVVVSLAGVRVDNTPSAFSALRALDPHAGGEVVVERQGVPTRIAVPPGAL